MNFRFSTFDFFVVAAKACDWMLARGCTAKSERRKSKSAPAFTLIEVLIALSIFALAAVVLGASYINVLISYEIAARSTQGDEDVKFARAQLLAIADPKKIEEGGDFESTGARRVRWSAQIEPTATADLFLVHFLCEINDPATLEPQKSAQDFRVLRPTWSDPAERDKLRQEARQRIEELNNKTAGMGAGSFNTGSTGAVGGTGFGRTGARGSGGDNIGKR